ncbi:MAG TPA: hypothetical protein VK190_03095 [Pseudoneobacillus sp.]|nr:hypothetical protein [Pseudoneobacillus sp.]
MYPNTIDQFTIKKNHIVDTTGHLIQEGDDVLAEHINAVQDSITAVETTLGTKPQGPYATLSDRLDSLQSTGVLKVPSVCIYYGDPKTINNLNNLQRAIDYYASFDYVIIDQTALDDVEPRATTAFAVINGSSNSFIGKVDISLTDPIKIKEKIYAWSQVNAAGVYFNKFDYTYIDRATQNMLIEYAHNLNLSIVISGNQSQIFDTDYVEGKNNYVPLIGLNKLDTYLIDNFAYNGTSFEDLGAEKSRMDALIEYKNQFEIQLWGISYISTQVQYYYVSAAAMMYSLDALFTSPSYTSSKKFSSMPLVGDYRTDAPVILASNGNYSRTTEFGSITLSPNGGYKFDGGKIPADFIDQTVIQLNSDNLTSLDASKLTGDINKDRMKAQVISAINSSVEATKISEAQLGAISGDKIAEAVKAVFASQDEIFINDLAVNVLHVLNDMTVDGTISADRLKANVIQAINAVIDNATINNAHIGELTSDHIKASVITAVNASIENATINAAKIGELTADHIKAAVIDAINANIGTAKIDQAKITELDAQHIQAAVIDAINANIGHAKIDSAIITDLTSDKIKTAVIDAINANIGTAKIDSAKIGELSAEHIKGVVIDAVNLNAGSAHIDQAVIPELDSTHIKAGVIEAVTAKIQELVASNLTADKAAIDSLISNFIEASNIHAENLTADSARLNSAVIGELTADHIKAAVVEAVTAKIETLLVEEANIVNGSIDNLVSKVIEAMNLHADNLTADTATIKAARIGAMDADHIQAAVIDAINANIGTAKIDAAVIDSLNADNIQAAVVEAVTARINELIASNLSADKAVIDQLTASIIKAVNLSATTVSAQVGTFDSAAIGNLTADKIQASVVQAVNGFFGTINAQNFSANQGYIQNFGANIIDAMNIKAGRATLGSATIDNAIIGTLSADNMKANIVDALTARVGDLNVSNATIDKASIQNLSSELIKAVNIYATTVTGDHAVFNTAVIGELGVDQLQANVLNALQAYVENLTATNGAFEQLFADVLKSNLINTSNVKITSAAGSAGPNDALLSIDQAGMTIQSKAVADSVTKVLRLTKDGMYISKDGGNLYDINGIQLNGHWDLKIDGNRLYIDSADINELAVNNAHIKDLSATKLIAGDIQANKSIRFVAAAGSLTGNSMIIDDTGMTLTDNPLEPRNWVKIDRYGISISKDGVNYSAKLDANKLYITEAEIPQISTDKLKAGTIDAGTIAVSGGDVRLDGNGLTINGSTGKGITINTADSKTIKLNKDGLVSDNFNISSTGAVAVTGTINGSGGYFGSSTNGVKINSTGLQITGTGSIKNNNMEMTADKLVVYAKDPIVALTIGQYATDKYGLYTNSGALILDDKGLTLKGGDSSIRMGVIDSTADTWKFKVTSDGKLIAQSADITGNINATSGSFGNSTNKVNVSNTGIDIGTGEIYSSDRKLVLNSSGITAKAGTIGAITIDDNGLHATNMLDMIGSGIKVTGSKAVTITNGTLVVTDGTNDYITVGKLGATSYGMRLDVPNSTTKVYLNETGFSIKKDATTTVFSADSSGNVKITGEINATKGSFSNVSVDGTITVGTNGSIVSGDATLNSTGLTISGTGSSISLGGGKFAVTGAGVLTAKSGTIGGLTISDSYITVGSNITLGKYDTTNYGLSISGTHGIIINSAGISSDNFSIATDTGNVSIKGAINATSGTFSGISVTGDITVTDGKIKAGGTTLDKNGIAITQGSITLGTNFALTGDGTITAAAGTIGGITIGSSTLTAGKVAIDKSGFITVKNGSDIEVIKLGEYSTNKYGMKLTAGSTIMTLDGNGLKATYTDAQSNVTTPFSLDSNGNLSITGAVNATSGSFTGTIYANAGNFASGKVSIGTNGLSVETGGIISAGNTKLKNTGIEIGTGGSINLNGNFVATDDGITAIAGSIGGWKITNGLLYSGTDKANASITLDAVNEQMLVGSNVLIGKYTENTTTYKGIKTGAITIDSRGFIAKDSQGNEKLKIDTAGNVTMTGTLNAASGQIGGWNIETNGITKRDASNNIIIDINSTNQYIMIKDAVKIGKYDTNNYGLQLGNVITFNTAEGLKSTNFNIDKDGNATFKGKVQGLSGYFGNDTDGVSIGTTGLNVVGYGIIKAGNTQLSSSGISIGAGSTINLSSKFLADDNGITAVAGKIANWTIANNTLSTSKISLDSSTEQISINGTDLIIGKYDGVHYGLSLGDNITFNNTYGLVVTDNSSNQKLVVDVDGNVTMNGTITSANGDIGGWKITSTGISKKDTSNNVLLDINSSTEIINIKDTVKLGKYDGTNYGLKLGTNIWFNATDGLKSTNFQIDKDGNATFNGVVTSASGYFGGSTNGVAISSTGLEVKGTGLIKNANTEMSSSAITIKNGTNSVIVLGQYASGKYGLASADQSMILDANGLTVKGSSSSIRLGVVDDSKDIYNFKVTSDGALIAQNANITGSINSSSGYFGNATNRLSITSTGIDLGTGKIVTSDNKLILDSNGITAQKGSIGGVTIGSTTLTAGSVVINNTGLIDIGSNMDIGLYDGTNYGIKLTTSNNKTIILNNTGLTANNGTKDTFKIDANGNVLMEGTITATAGSFTGNLYSTNGYFGGSTDHVLIGSTGLTIEGSGSIKLSDNTVKLDSNGLTMSKGSIALGTTFNVDNAGNMTATKATFGKVTVDNYGLNAAGNAINDRGIQVSGVDSMQIMDGSMACKNEAGFEVVRIGKQNVNGSTAYGMVVQNSSVAYTNYGTKSALTEGAEKVFNYISSLADRTKLKHMRLRMTLS